MYTFLFDTSKIIWSFFRVWNFQTYFKNTYSKSLNSAALHNVVWIWISAVLKNRNCIIWELPVYFFQSNFYWLLLSWEYKCIHLFSIKKRFHKQIYGRLIFWNCNAFSKKFADFIRNCNLYLKLYCNLCSNGK